MTKAKVKINIIPSAIETAELSVIAALGDALAAWSIELTEAAKAGAQTDDLVSEIRDVADAMHAAKQRMVRMGG